MKAQVWIRASHIVCCLAVVLSFSLALEGNAKAAQVKDVPFGIIDALSGPAAPWGIASVRAAAVASEEINAKGFVVNGVTYKWKVIEYDNKLDPKEGRTGIERLINSDGAKFVQVMGSGSLLASKDILLKNNIFVFVNAFSGIKLTNPDLPLWFRFITGPTERVLAFYPYLKKKHNLKNIAVISLDSDSGISGVEDSENAAKVSGLNLVAKEIYTAGTTDFYSVLTKILAKKPDMIDTSVSSGDDTALITKQARELGFKGIIYIGTMTDANSFVKIATKPFAEGTYFGGAVVRLDTDFAKKFHGRFVNKYGEKEWEPITLECAPPLYILTEAIKKAQSFDTEKIAKVMENLPAQHYAGEGRWGGVSKYGIKRQITVPEYLGVIRDGKLVHETRAPAPKDY